MIASRKEQSREAITRSMGLKFFLQAKQRARLVLGFTAESKPEQRGQRKRRKESLNLLGSSKREEIRSAMGIWFLKKRNFSGGMFVIKMGRKSVKSPEKA